MASGLLAMASTLVAVASNLVVTAWVSNTEYIFKQSARVLTPATESEPPSILQKSAATSQICTLQQELESLSTARAPSIVARLGS